MGYCSSSQSLWLSPVTCTHLGPGQQLLCRLQTQRKQIWIVQVSHPPHFTHVPTKTKNRKQNRFSCFWKIAFFVIEKYFQTVLSFFLVMDVPRTQCLKQPASSNLLNHFGVAKTVLCLPIDPSPFAWVCYYATTHPKRFKGQKIFFLPFLFNE